MQGGNKNDTRNNLSVNLLGLRKHNKMSQEEVAEQVGVTRQAVAKWESGETLPDIVNCDALADLFNVSLNDLVRYDPEKEGIPIAPKDKHIFGMVTINEKGQIVLPKLARDTLGFIPGTTLIVLGDTTPHMEGLALVDSKAFLNRAGHAMEMLFKGE